MAIHALQCYGDQRRCVDRDGEFVMSLTHPETMRDEVTLAGAVFAILGTLWTAFTYAIDYEQTLVKQPQLRAIVVEQQMSLDAMKRDTLESKIFELNLIEHPTKPQQALLIYYQQKLDELNKKRTR